MPTYRDPPPTEFTYAVFIAVGHVEPHGEVFVPLFPTKMSLGQLRDFVRLKLPSEDQMRYILSALTRPEFKPTVVLARYHGHHMGEKAECLVQDVFINAANVGDFRMAIQNEFGFT